MCTAIHDHNYFGRTLDLEISYGEKIAIVPRGYEFNISGETTKNPHAIIGVANLADGYPLFYDAINERGLGVAALNFPGNAAYFEPIAGKHNVNSYELIPWLLATCDSVNSAVSLLGDTVITNVAFSNKLKPTPLHWIIADRTGAITVEQTVSGLNIYDNPLLPFTHCFSLYLCFI